LLLFVAPGLVAQSPPDAPGQSGRLRFDVTPLIGYRTSMSFPADTTTEGSGISAIFDAASSYGVSAGYRLDELDLVEFRWARQKSHFHLEGSPPSASESATLDQFLGDFTHEYAPDDWPAWARPFVTGSVGASHVSAGSGNSFTRFTFGLGGGVKFYFGRHFGLRLEGEWLPVFVEPEVGSFVCGGGCVVHLNATVVSQGEFVAGPMFRF
jgi:hypothetical protein